MSIIVKTKVREKAQYRGRSLRVSSEFFAVFEEKVLEILKECCRRAHDNDRTTLLAKDI
jgi:hypothetical protein